MKNIFKFSLSLVVGCWLLAVGCFSASAQNAIRGNAATTNLNGGVWNMQKSGMTNIGPLNASSINTTGAVVAASVSATSLAGNGGALTHVIISNLDGTLDPAQAPALAKTYEDTRPITFVSQNVTNLSIGGNLFLSATTNAVHNSQGGDPNSVGNFQTNGITGQLTNIVTHQVIWKISTLYYFVTTNGTLQYSSPNLFTTNWTQINGAYPVPNTTPAAVADFSSIAPIGTTLGNTLFGFTPYTPSQVDTFIAAAQALELAYSTNAANDVVVRSNLINAANALNAARLIAQTNGTRTAPVVLFTNTETAHYIDLQSLFNALPHSPNKATPGGGTIELGSGIYYTGGASWTNNYYDDDLGVDFSGIDTLVIKGKGIGQTALVFTNNSGITMVGVGQNLSLVMQGMIVASTVDSNYFLVHVQNNNKGLIDDCTFAYWPIIQGNLEAGLAISANSAQGLGGVHYDGYSSFGDIFTIQNCNFDGLYIGAVLAGNHPRLYNNFFEGINRSNQNFAAHSSWPVSDPLSLGGAVFINRGGDFSGAISSFGAIGNHWFNCSNNIVDLRITSLGDPANEVTFRDSEFEYGNAVLILTNSADKIFLDGVTWSIPSISNFKTNIAGYAPLNSYTGNNYNLRWRASDHQYGSYTIDNIISTNYTGNGAGLTNVPVSGLSGMFVSTNVNLSSGVTFFSLPHNLGRMPYFVQARLVCVTADVASGYTVTDEIDTPTIFNAAQGQMEFTVTATVTNVLVSLPIDWPAAVSDSEISMTLKNGGGLANPSAASNFKLKLLAW